MAHTPPGRTRERVWRFVRDRLLSGSPPTVREVQAAFGFRAVESARAHLDALVAAGRLEKDAGRSRGYRLAAAVSPFAGPGRAALVPVLGRVQAGALTTAVEEAEGAVAVRTRFPPEELFALRVRGDSMRGAGILDGDLVVVRRQETAEDGRIVVALVGEEATVKRLRLVRGPGGGGDTDAGPRPGGGRSDDTSSPDDTGSPDDTVSPDDTGDGRTGPAPGTDADRGSRPGGRPGAGPGGGAALRVELHPENPDFPVIVPPPGEARILGRVVEVRRDLDRDTARDRVNQDPAGEANRDVPRDANRERNREPNRDADPAPPAGGPRRRARPRPGPGPASPPRPATGA